jgi:hypothetical protein
MPIAAIFGLIVLGLLALGYATGSSTATAAAGSPAMGPDDDSGEIDVSAGSPDAAQATSGTGYNSDSSLTGAPITNDPSTWPGVSLGYANGNVWNICAAVALAEGYNGGPGVAPYDLNDPGDLSPGDEAGQATAGAPQAHGGSEIIFFATAEGGWIALYHKFLNIVTGNSTVYPKTLTWAQVAKIYAGNSAAWLNNVTSYLGVDSTSTPAQYAGTV